MDDPGVNEFDLAEQMIAEVRSWPSHSAVNSARLTKMARRSVVPEMLATYLALQVADDMDGVDLLSLELANQRDHDSQ
jgi:hypothetical protein